MPVHDSFTRLIRWVSLFLFGMVTVAHASWYEVYFSQVTNDAAAAKQNPASIDRILEQKLSQAKTSIDAALHEIDSDRIAGALIQAHDRGVKVRIVTEYDYLDELSIEDLQEAGVRVVHDSDRSGLMHNKFIIVDGRSVWTGSYNTTDNGAYKNNNNAIWIESPELAQNYTTEFVEMFEKKTFGWGSPMLPHPHVMMADGTKLISAFTPEYAAAGVVVDYLEQAQTSIYFMAFSFTHDAIGKAMLERFKAGVDVRGVFETRGAKTRYSEYPAMSEAGMPVMTDHNKWAMHHKVIIIDGKTVITGSFNFSKNAARTNDENVLFIDGNSDIAARYTEEFHRVMNPPMNAEPDEPVPQPLQASGGAINVNTASQVELEQLPGIGPALAKRIVEGRPYQSLPDLDEVKGLGKKKLQAMQGLIRFE